MSKSIVVTVVLLLIVTVAGTAFLLDRTTNMSSQPVVHSPAVTPADSINNDITQEFSDKYNKEAGEVEITVEVNTGEYAKGSIRFTDEMGGAIWFGAKKDGKWLLAADGQGPMTCEVADKYAFPLNLVPECISESGDLTIR